MKNEEQHRSKQMLKDLGKRSACYLKITSTTNNGVTVSTITDDVGCPVGNVLSYSIEYNPDMLVPVLTLKISAVAVDIVTT